MWLTWLLYTVAIIEWLIRLAMLPYIVSRHRRGTNAALSWLLLILIEPLLGLLLYMAIGRHWLPRRRIAQVDMIRGELRQVVRRFESHPSLTDPGINERLLGKAEFARRLGLFPVIGDNDVEFVSESSAFVDRLVEDIDRSTKYVHLLFYIYADDATGRRVGDAMIRAVERGVECRLLVDAVGSRRMLAKLAPSLRHHGVQVAAALPVGIFRRRFSRIDLRNHRKLAVIDGYIAYSGSQNVTDPDYGRGALNWRDVMARLTGPVALELHAVFSSDWYYETHELLVDERYFVDPPDAGEIAAQVLPSGPTYPRENFQRFVVAAIHAARDTVIITTPYFVPDEPTLQAIEVASLRGVQVTLVVPRKCDQILVGAATRAYYEDVLRVGTRLLQFHGGLMHAKMIVIDDAIGLVGSSNFDIRSFALNFEVTVLLYGKAVTKKMRQIVEHFMKESDEVTLEQWLPRPRILGTTDNIARLFSPLL